MPVDEAGPRRRPGLARGGPTAGDRSRRSTLGSPPCACDDRAELLEPGAARERRRARGAPRPPSSVAMPAQHEHPRRQTNGQALEIRGPASLQRLDRLDHFVRVADGAPERRVHRRQQRLGPDAVALGDARTATRRACARRLRVFMNAPRPTFTSSTSAPMPFGDLLAQDRRADERNALDRAGDVAQRVEPPIGRRDLVGLADQHAAGRARARAHLRRARAACEIRESPRACRACRPCGRGRVPTSSARPRRTRRRAARESSDVLSPTPPVECLSTGVPPNSDRSSRCPIAPSRRSAPPLRRASCRARRSPSAARDLIVGPRSVGHAGDERADVVGRRARRRRACDESDRPRACGAKYSGKP